MSRDASGQLTTGVCVCVCVTTSDGSRASDPHIRVISEGSCDFENWSNDAEMITEINYTLLYIYIYIYSHLEMIVTYHLFCLW